jgi:uncharacterized protein YyaL (SSP411 family)
MAHECFEDENIAALLNESFISIKIDKEERPDIDTVYMSVCQTITGSGGWPLTIFMTPEQKPFYTATYIPKETRYGMLGLTDLLKQIDLQWHNNQDDILHTGDQIVMLMKHRFDNIAETKIVSKDIINMAITQFNQSFDHDYGGFSNEPKFPSPHNLMFLLRYACLEADEASLFMVENTLKHMYRGGIYDHVGFGFSRYSTDARWLVPHFEKILYDNALLAITYLEAFQYTKEPLYQSAGEQILEYIRREMTDREGGFYCAQDADSEGIEGKYYVFTPEEINAVLDSKDASFFCEYFDITKEGNFNGYSIPNLIKAAEIKPGSDKMALLCNKIYSYRLNRSKLHKDDKILTSWNALMIIAYAKAAKILQKQEYCDTAKRAVDFINTKLTNENGRIYIRYREDKAAYYGLLDDYAFFSMALLELYDATFEVSYLKQATTLADQMIVQFWDQENGGFYLNPKDLDDLIYRPKETYDGAIPSGNAAAGYVLQRLAHLTVNNKYQNYADRQLEFLAGQIGDYPINHSFSLIAFMEVLYPSKEIVCVASEASNSKENIRTIEKNQDYSDLRDYLSKHFEPNTIALLKTAGNSEELEKLADYVKDYSMLNDKTTYYVCENHICHAPCNELYPVSQRKMPH